MKTFIDQPDKKQVLAAATGNHHKIEEITAVLSPLGIRVISKDEAGARDFDPDETGDTFEENSYIKARALLDMTGQPSIADDSGLEVNALGGAPGVLSARFSSEDEPTGESTDKRNNTRLLHLLEYVPDEDRTARFVCVITALWPDGRQIVSRGECCGHILRVASGAGGFGYDPLFVPDEFAAEGLSFADISAEQKNRISHRARALAAFAAELAKL
ncbi:MAG: RdgB/HAM1 family non-canonical purine NTP pyrophosphatase [Clostridiales Family XIII bacterium]|jgi:XTP/dITP diphosphohydrolase|nr:RdgB/HAM1 family non-canonical purine NTP pyrophosphatase [Clostridiales Family XIII bacterium]